MCTCRSFPGLQSVRQSFQMSPTSSFRRGMDFHIHFSGQNVPSGFDVWKPFLMHLSVRSRLLLVNLRHEYGYFRASVIEEVFHKKIVFEKSIETKLMIRCALDTWGPSASNDVPTNISGQILTYLGWFEYPKFFVRNQSISRHFGASEA